MVTLLSCCIVFLCARCIDRLATDEWPLKPTKLIELLVPPRSMVILWHISVTEPNVWLSILCANSAARCPSLLPPVTAPHVLCSPGGTWLPVLSLPISWKLVLALVVPIPILVLVRVPVSLTRPLVSSIVLDVWCNFSMFMTSLLWLDTIRLPPVHRPVTLTRFLVRCVVCVVTPGLNLLPRLKNVVIVRAEGMVRPTTCACEWTAGNMLRVSGVYKS